MDRQEALMIRDLERLMERAFESEEHKKRELFVILDKAFGNNQTIDPAMGEIRTSIQKELNVDIAEVYSPPRIADMANRMNLIGGWSPTSPLRMKIANHGISESKKEEMLHSARCSAMNPHRLLDHRCARIFCSKEFQLRLNGPR